MVASGAAGSMQWPSQGVVRFTEMREKMPCNITLYAMFYITELQYWKDIYLLNLIPQSPS